MFARNVITWCDSTRLAPRIGGAHARSLATSLYIGVLLAACFGGCPAAPQGPDGGNWPDAQGGGGDGTGADGDLGVDPATSPQGIDPASIPGGDDSLRVIDLKVATFQGLPLTVTLKPEDLQADPAGFGAISIALVSPPLVGTLAGPEQLGQGAVRYTYLSPVDFAGTVQFGYFAFNDEGESNVGTVEIVVYPEIRFTVDAGTGLRGAIASPDDQALALLSGSLNHSPASVIVAANARTVGGDPLPDGVYTWAFDGVEESGPMATHQQQSHLFSGGGLHAVTLSVLLSGISGPVACKTIPAGTEQAQVIIDPAIWGQIVDETGQPLPDVQVQVSQTASTVTTAADGVYVARVPYGWAGTLTASLAGYSFAPAQPSFLSVTRDIGNTDFVGTQEAPALMLVSPTADMTSSGNPGGPFSPASTVYTVENTGNQPLSWTASKTQNWVSLSNVGGTLAPGASDTVVVSINSSANGLAPGSYRDTVSFTNVTNGSGNTARGVSLVVNSLPGPSVLLVSPASAFSSSGSPGGPFNPASQVYTVENTGSQPLSWTASHNQNWVSLSNVGGTLAPGASDTVVVSINSSANGLAAGSYRDTVSFTNVTNGIGDTARGVSLVVNSLPGALLVSPASAFSSSGNPGGPFNPASQVYTVENTGSQPLSWTASENENWVSLSKVGGNLAPGASDTVVVSINSNANGLAAGSYSDTVNFTNVTNGSGDSGRGVSLDIHGQAVALEAPFTSQPVTVDGTMSPGEWQDAFSYSEDASDLVPPGVVVQGSTTGPSDTSATIHLKHDSNYLYIAVEVTDDTIIQTAPNVWEADDVEVFLDHDNSRTANVGFNRMQFTVNAGGSLGEGGAVPPGSWNGAASTSASGFVVEYRISKAALGLAQTGSYGFDIAISDVEPVAGAYDTRYWYFSTAEASANETLWGDIILLAGGGTTGGVLAVSPGAGLTSSGNEGGPFSPAGKQYVLTNTGDAPLDWSASNSQPWLDLSSAGGTLAAGASATVTVSINASANGLTAGIYQDSITFTNDTNGAGDTSRPVSLTVNSSVGVLAVTPGGGFSSSGIAGGPFAPSSLTYTLDNVGASPIDYSVAKSAAWLSLNGGAGPLTGTLAPAATFQVIVSINANANGLSAATYNDSVAFANTTNGLGDTARPISLTVNSSAGVLAVTPAVGLSSSGVAGGPFTPSSITYTLDNVGPSPIDFSVAKSAAWLSLNGGAGPLTGTLAPAQTFQVIVSINANANGLTANTYNDSVAFANTTNGLGDTARSVSLNVRTPGSGTPTPVIIASRISGMAPFAVFFEGTESTDSQGRSIGDSSGSGNGLLGNDLVEYTWDFGPGSENDVGGRYFSGFNAAHVYETAGQYDVRLTVREEAVPGQSSSASTTLRVDAQAFAGTTYYVRAAGNDNNTGTGPSAGQAWRTYGKAFNAIRRNSVVQPGDRVLFNRGDVFNYSSGVHLGSARDVLISAYGTGNRPRLQYTAGAGGNAAIQGSANAISVVDIHIHGNDAANGFDAKNNQLFLRTLVEHYYNNVCYTNGLFIVDSVLTNADKQNMYFSGSRLVLINNSIGPVAREHNLYGSVINRAVITGNHFHDAHGAGLRIAANRSPGSWNVVVSANQFERMPSPVELKVTSPGVPYAAHNILIERNQIRGWVWIADLGGHTDVIVRNNLLDRLVLDVDNVPWSNPRRGVQGLRFCNNTLTYGGTSAAIKIETSDHSDVQLFNNIIQAKNGASGILVLEFVVPSGVAGVASDYNLFDLPSQSSNPRAFRIGGTNYTFAQWQTNFSQDINGLMADPLFNPASPSGLELLPGSPAIDRGQTLRLVYEDYSSPPIRRPAGAYDIGAFER